MDHALNARSLLITWLGRGTLHLVRVEDSPWLQALVHLLLLTSLRGLIVRRPMMGTQQAFVLVRDWLEDPGMFAGRRTHKGGAAAPAPVQRDRALAELARRYLRGHGPAEDRDLARWAGPPIRDARAGLGAVASELQQRSDGLVDLRARPPAAEPPPRLLGAFALLAIADATAPEADARAVERYLADRGERPG